MEDWKLKDSGVRVSVKEIFKDCRLEDWGVGFTMVNSFLKIEVKTFSLHPIIKSFQGGSKLKLEIEKTEFQHHNMNRYSSFDEIFALEPFI